MKKVIVVNGIIAGLIVSAMTVITQPLLKNGTINYDNGMIVGYTSMVIALSMIFFGIKTYRDQYRGGSVSFLEGSKIGLGIALIASLLYAITWEVYFNVAAQDFMDQYTEYYLKKMEDSGASAEEITVAKADMAAWNERYKNPFIRFAVTLMEILPVGIVITAISAGILRKHKILPA